MSTLLDLLYVETGYRSESWHVACMTSPSTTAAPTHCLCACVTLCMCDIVYVYVYVCVCVFRESRWIAPVGFLFLQFQVHYFSPHLKFEVSHDTQQQMLRGSLRDAPGQTQGSFRWQGCGKCGDIPQGGTGIALAFCLCEYRLHTSRGAGTAPAGCYEPTCQVRLFSYTHQQGIWEVPREVQSTRA